MAVAYDQQLYFTQAGAQTLTVDASQSAVSVPRRVQDYVSYSAQTFGATTAKGALQVWVSNAPVAGGKLVGAGQWVALPDLALDVGGKDTLPAIQEKVLNAQGWVQLSWTPGSNSTGTFQVLFDGVRRG